MSGNMTNVILILLIQVFSIFTANDMDAYIFMTHLKQVLHFIMNVKSTTKSMLC